MLRDTALALGRRLLFTGHLSSANPKHRLNGRSPDQTNDRVESIAHSREDVDQRQEVLDFVHHTYIGCSPVSDHPQSETTANKLER